MTAADVAELRAALLCLRDEIDRLLKLLPVPQKSPKRNGWMNL